MLFQQFIVSFIMMEAESYPWTVLCSAIAKSYLGVALLGQIVWRFPLIFGIIELVPCGIYAQLTWLLIYGHHERNSEGRSLSTNVHGMWA